MSATYHYQSYHTSTPRKNRYRSKNFRNSLHFKQENDQWLTPFLEQTYQLFAPLFNPDDELEQNRIIDRYYFNETNLDKDFDKSAKKLIPDLYFVLFG